MKRPFVPALALIAGLLAWPCFARADSPAPSIEKLIHGRAVKLPVLPGFAPACEENEQIAKRMRLMAPKSAVFVTCFVDAAKWREFLAGGTPDLYPFIAVSVDVPTSGAGYTPEVFEKIRAAAHAQLGDLLGETKDARDRQLAAQDAAMAASGIPLSRSGYQQRLQGFFATPGAPVSFSYLAMRSATISAGGVSRELHEANAVSMILVDTRLLGLNVVDQSAADPQGRRAQAVTTQWLRAFRALNGGDGQ